MVQALTILVIWHEALCELNDDGVDDGVIVPAAVISVLSGKRSGLRLPRWNDSRRLDMRESSEQQR
ncbi:hypothetical protein BAQU_0619 [Bifidobacterium aquikefiri]|uniref:Uncharacterized protein n=1 Tax=Bifidobacterium aquikefiri TaxID=1653207 RepID=A0A261G987_9BIFI|nr:hypothetical protein BAQU_0619 [Bifidobacterium aquikefiri]